MTIIEQISKGNWHLIIGDRGQCACGVDKDGNTVLCKTILQDAIRNAFSTYNKELKAKIEAMKVKTNNDYTDPYNTADVGFNVALKEVLEVLHKI